MAVNVANIKVCSPLKQRSGLTGKYHAICHYSYNLPLAAPAGLSETLRPVENPVPINIEVIIRSEDFTEGPLIMAFEVNTDIDVI